MQQGPEQLGRYKVIRRLGLGGMAEVFLAERTSSGGFTKKLVIKRLLPHLAPDPRMVEQLEREARIGALLTHPNLVQTWDLDVDERGTPFIVLEYVQGRTLKALAHSTWGRGLPLPIELSVGAIADAALGLHYLHEAREGDKHLELVHRDISPDNLMIEDDGTVRVMDFGVARMGAATVALTEEGELKGKIPFMPPEQLKGADVDRRCDIYALGVTLYWLLSGKRPFEDGSDIDGKPAVEMNPAVLIQRALADPVPAVSQLNSEVPGELEDVVMSMLAKEPDGRIATAAEVHDQLLNVVPIARSACEAFMREGRKPAQPTAQPKRATTALAARMLTVPQRKAWTPEDGGRATTLQMPAADGRSETISSITAIELAESRKRMGLSAVAGAAVAMLACMLGLALFGGGEDEKLKAPPPPPGVNAPSKDDDSSSDPSDYDEPSEPEPVEDVGDSDSDTTTGHELEEPKRRRKTGRRRGSRPSRERTEEKQRATDDEEPEADDEPADDFPDKPVLVERATTRPVRLQGGSKIAWRAGDKELGTGNQTQDIATSIKRVTAFDPRLQGTIRVRVRDGIADLRRVREGRLQIFASPAITNIKVGTMNVQANELITLRDGVYTLHYTVNRRPKEVDVRVKAGRSKRVTLR